MNKDEQIEALLTRGVEHIYPSREFLEAKLKSGEQQRVYLGIDPTGPTLHIGHAIPLQKLREFQNLGHKVVLLIGSFTAMIGDPDKASVRNQLTKSEVEENMKHYLTQASKIIDTKNPDVFELRYNDEWLAQMTFEEVLTLTSKMTVQQMIERDLFDKRIKEGKPVYLHEFLYPLMQGYDSVALNVSGEVGGNDQTFNMLTGRTLMKEILGQEKFVITTKLLVDPTGKKMGKSEGNMITLEDSPREMFGKIMSWPDTLITTGLELCTTVPRDEIEVIQEKLKTEHFNPKEAKMFLAHETVKRYFSEREADEAEEQFEETFSNGEVPEEVMEIEAEGLVMPIIVREGLVESNSEARRLLEAGAVTDITADKKMTLKDEVIKDHVYRVGKHRFIKIV